MAAKDPEGAFRAHANYLRAFASIAGGDSLNRGEALRLTLDRLLASSRLPDGPSPIANTQQAYASMRNAWGTELLLGVTDRVIDSEELIRLSNNWSVVQAYYVIYHSTQALAVSKGFNRPDSHPKTQKQFHSFFANRNGLEPWSLAFGYSGPENVPPDVVANHGIHPWSACNPRNRWGLAYMALRTTREDFLPVGLMGARKEKQRKNREAWGKEENKRQSAGRRSRKEPAFRLPRLIISEKESVARKLRPYTLIDYLFRLRIRTNYEDSAMFTDGPKDNVQSEVVQSDLILISSCSLLVAELYVRQLVGPSVFDQWVSDWVSANAQFNPPLGVAERQALHRGVT